MYAWGVAGRPPLRIELLGGFRALEEGRAPVPCAQRATTADRLGDKLDRKASQTLGPGGFVSLPAKMNHFAWVATPTVVQISLEGPFDIVYVNPADNPQQTKSTN